MTDLQDCAGILATLRSTGLNETEAWSHLWQTKDPVVRAYALAKVVWHLGETANKVDDLGASLLGPALKVLFRIDPELGNEAVMALPPGFEVQASYLFLDGCRELKGLPDRFSVAGFLDLTDCSSLVALPSGLRLKGTLDMRRCDAWNGVVPPDAVIDGRILTQ
jgi:hypothetical protein